MSSNNNFHCCFGPYHQSLPLILLGFLAIAEMGVVHHDLDSRIVHNYGSCNWQVPKNGSQLWTLLWSKGAYASHSAPNLILLDAWEALIDLILWEVRRVSTVRVWCSENDPINLCLSPTGGHMQLFFGKYSLTSLIMSIAYMMQKVF